MINPNTAKQRRRRAALSLGLEHIRLWVTPDNKPAVIDAKEQGDKMIEDVLREAKGG